MNEPNKLPLVKQSLALLVQQMREQDRIAIVVYALGRSVRENVAVIPLESDIPPAPAPAIT